MRYDPTLRRIERKYRRARDFPPRWRFVWPIVLFGDFGIEAALRSKPLGCAFFGLLSVVYAYLALRPAPPAPKGGSAWVNGMAKQAAQGRGGDHNPG